MLKIERALKAGNVDLAVEMEIGPLVRDRLQRDLVIDGKQPLVECQPFVPIVPCIVGRLAHHLEHVSQQIRIAFDEVEPSDLNAPLESRERQPGPAAVPTGASRRPVAERHVGLARKQPGYLARSQKLKLPSVIGPEVAKDDLPIRIHAVLHEDVPKLPVTTTAFRQGRDCLFP